MNRTPTYLGLALLGAILLCSVPLGAQPPAAAQVATLEPTSSETEFLVAMSEPALLDVARLEPLFDEKIAARMERWKIPGVAVAVVEGGQVVLEKGWGLADLKGSRPMTPRSVVRAASVSKVLTAAAVLDLVEQGKLDLQAPVNGYLKSFQLDDEGEGGPIRVHHLLTHTAGLEEIYIGSAARVAAEQLSLEKYLAANVPRRVLPTGLAVSYTNQGYALAGRLIELATGTSFEDDLQRRFFGPLGMEHSAFVLSDVLAADLATGYVHDGESYTVSPYDYQNHLPASGLLTNAEDMRRFMIAVLAADTPGGGELGGLSAAVARGLMTRSFQQHPLLVGRTACCFEKFHKGQRIVGHDGDIRGFATAIYLLPEHDIGLFVAYNNQISWLREELVEALVDEFLPEVEEDMETGMSLATSPPPTATTTDVEEMVGTYRFLRYPRSTLDKISVLVGYAPEALVELNPQGGLEMIGGGEEREMVEVEPGFYQVQGEVDPGNGKGLAFHTDNRGEVDMMFFDELAFERLAWYETSSLHYMILLVSILSFLLTLLILVISSVLRRRRQRATPPAEALVRRFAGLMSFLGLLFLGLFAGTLIRVGAYEFVFGLPGLVGVAVFLPPLTALLAVALPMALWRGRRELASKLWVTYFALLSCVGLGFVFFLTYWHLLLPI